MAAELVVGAPCGREAATSAPGFWACAVILWGSLQCGAVDMTEPHRRRHPGCLLKELSRGASRASCGLVKPPRSVHSRNEGHARFSRRSCDSIMGRATDRRSVSPTVRRTKKGLQNAGDVGWK